MSWIVVLFYCLMKYLFAKGFHYDCCKQKICGFEDLGPLGRTDRYANHALVFMVRGIKSNYKQAVAFYFTRDSISTKNLKQIIVDVINQLQEIGLNVVTTVCDQGSTNRSAIRELCEENRGQIPKEAMHTAEFVAMIDNLFDSLNGSQLHPSEG
ncbi:Tnp P element domain containing protein, partial [Asbolus verrucosus]